MPGGRFTLDALALPIVQAPLAGGPSTPALAAAVSDAGGLGFLAFGYKAPDAAARELQELRERTDAPFGVNVFAPPGREADPASVERYVETLAAEALDLGAARHDDDAWDAKLALLAEAPPAVVSFTFGCPPADVLGDVRRAGSAAWVTVTTPEEAEHAAEAGADGLVVQGVEAGGHRASFDDARPGDYGLLALLQLVRDRTSLPLVAAGGIATGRAVAAVLALGASAAAVGTALMRAPEAATSAPHRAALARGAAPTGLTRAFSGRTARGIVNRFQREHSADAPSAYPEIHHVTAPLRAAARAAGDTDAINLWAGQAYPLAREAPAAEIVRGLADEARAVLRELGAR